MNERGQNVDQPRRILIVDDEEHVRFIVADALNRLGPDVEVVEAGSGEEAMDKIRQAPFDLVITDLRMPGMTGQELTRAIVETCPGATVIWMTAYGSQDVRAEAALLSVYRCLDKPLDVADIRRIVRQALEGERNLPLGGQ